MMRRISLLLHAVFLALSAPAQIAVTSSSLTYTQDFNTLDSNGTSQTTMPAGWSFHEWGGASVNATYRCGAGTATTGDTYSFGKSNSRERSLGSLCSGGVPNVVYGASFINNTGAYINAFTITFKEEQWRRNGSGNTDSVRFYYSNATGNSVADTTFSSWYQVPALLMTSITTAVPASALDGNDTSRIITATVPIALAAGGAISLRWYDFNGAGNDDALSIDSLTVTFSPGAPSMALRPAIIAFSPAPDAANVAPLSSLTITFDKNITAGAGSIYVQNRTLQAMQAIAATSANVAISGKVATINGLGLTVGNMYHITFDSTAFDTAGFYAAGIYDTTAWRFTVSGGQGIGSFAQPATLPITVVNPADNGTFHLRCTVSQSVMLTVSVYDLAGRRVACHAYHAVKGDNRITLHSLLPAGMYIVRVDDGKEWGNAKVVLQ